MKHDSQGKKGDPKVSSFHFLEIESQEEGGTGLSDSECNMIFRWQQAQLLPFLDMLKQSRTDPHGHFFRSKAYPKEMTRGVPGVQDTSLSRQECDTYASPGDPAEDFETMSSGVLVSCKPFPMVPFVKGK